MEDPVTPSDLGEHRDFQSTSEWTSRPSSSPADFAMTVEIKEGQVGVLKVRVDDDPQMLATEFATKHGLDPEQVELLIQYIIQNQSLAGTTSNIESDMPQLLLDRHENNVKTRVLPKTSVHDRLYQYRKKHSTEAKLATTPPASIGRSSLNYGNWLYIKGIQRKEALKVKLEKQKAEETQLLSKSMTFHPSINRFSSIITPRVHVRTDEMLYGKAAELKEKLALQRSSSEMLRLKQCSFAPKITLHAHQMSPAKPSFARLYEDAAERTAKKMQAATSQQFPFQPHLYASKFSEKVDSRDFLERMTHPKPSSKPSISPEKHTEALPKPTSTVKISRDGRPIHDYLYSLKDKQEERIKQASIERNKDLETMRNQPKTGVTSQKYLQEMYEKAGKRLFSVLKSEESDVISGVPEGVFDAKVSELLAGVIRGEEVDLEQFVSRFEDLLARLPLTERDVLLHAEAIPRPVSAEKPKGKPENDIYMRSKAAQERIQAKLQEQQVMKEKMNAKDCTFRPFTVKGRRSHVVKSRH